METHYSIYLIFSDDITANTQAPDTDLSSHNLYFIVHPKYVYFESQEPITKIVPILTFMFGLVLYLAIWDM